MDFEKTFEEINKKAERIKYLGEIYNKVLDDMNWACRDYHSSDEEHEDTWFSDPDENDYRYEEKMYKMEVYEEVLAAIEKLAK